jgi:hypothetical protein
VTVLLFIFAVLMAGYFTAMGIENVVVPRVRARKRLRLESSEEARRAAFDEETDRLEKACEVGKYNPVVIAMEQEAREKAAEAERARQETERAQRRAKKLENDRRIFEQQLAYARRPDTTREPADVYAEWRAKGWMAMPDGEYPPDCGPGLHRWNLRSGLCGTCGTERGVVGPAGERGPRGLDLTEVERIHAGSWTYPCELGEHVWVLNGDGVRIRCGLCDHKNPHMIEEARRAVEEAREDATARAALMVYAARMVANGTISAAEYRRLATEYEATTNQYQRTIAAGDITADHIYADGFPYERRGPYDRRRGYRRGYGR